MDKYNEYHLEDFVLDAGFQRWVRFGEESDTGFWQAFQKDYPGKVADVNAARILLEGVYASSPLIASEEEIQTEISGLIDRIQAGKSSKPTDQKEEPRTEPLIIRTKWWWAAASIVLLGVVGLWFVLRTKSEVQQLARFENELTIEKTNNGPKAQQVRLEDGTVVELHPGSTLRYNQNFDKTARQVSLSGAAFFQVAKDADRPFLVYTPALVTRVLGTTFLVRSFKDAHESTVEVTEGRVSVYRRSDFVQTANGSQSLARGTILTANQRVIFQKDRDVMTKSLVEVPKIVPTERTLPAFVYRNTPIVEVLEEIERAYQVDIIFDEEQLKDCPVTASLSNQTLLEKIEIICETVEARFEVLDGQIVVYGKKCS